MLLFGIGLCIYTLLTQNVEKNSQDVSENATRIDRAVVAEVDPIHTITPSSDIGNLGQFKHDYIRTVALRALLATSDEQQVLALLSDSKSISPDDQRQTTQLEIFRRLTVIDPELAVERTFEINIPPKTYEDGINFTLKARTTRNFRTIVKLDYYGKTYEVGRAKVRIRNVGF